MIETFAGRFLLLRRLGQGGMGEVFLARDLTTGAECALKRLSPAAAAALPGQARHEFEALTRIRHPLLVAVHEFGVSPEGAPYCTLEYVPGVPADRAIARGDWASLCYLGSQIALGLEFLHSVQVAHGDLKPANVLVVPAEAAGERPRSIRLLDFGLAGMLEKPGAKHTGTPGYAAPEVVLGAEITASNDLSMDSAPRSTPWRAGAPPSKRKTRTRCCVASNPVRPPRCRSRKRESRAG